MTFHNRAIKIVGTMKIRSNVTKGMNTATKVHRPGKGNASYSRKEFKNTKNWEN